ncbi:hypothetical protein GCM10022377_22390 [Zhihengliuella alba]|uniref:MacB-like periplasmic core domain-containing protein n=1 Tax=Zhihengliuella alba TaxID=547018 RepID=A0ABP7DRA8_9MICC
MELVFDLRRNWLILTCKALTWALLAVTVFNIASFAQSTDTAINRSFSAEAETNMYQLVDRLADPEDFYEFRQSRTNLEQLGAFYDELNEADEFDLLSVFDQPVPVRDFRGNETFDAGYGTEGSVGGPYTDEVGRRVQDVKAVQLNQKAFDFYRLAVSEGTPPDWGDVDYSDGAVPVLLGSSYAGVYEVGDVIDGNFYTLPMRMQVTGILEEEASLYYQGEMNFYLDHHLLIPYPPSAEQFAAQDQVFYGILYFAMVNADIAVPRGLSTDQVLGELAEASDHSGFEHYAVANLPDYLLQFSLVKSIIQDNLALVQGIGVLLCLGVLVASGFANAQLLRRRQAKALAFWRLGYSRGAIRRMLLLTALVQYAAATAGTAVGLSLLPQASPAGLWSAAGVLVLLVSVDAAHESHLLRRLIDHTSGRMDT